VAVPVVLTWAVRLEPLPPAAVLGRGSVAALLAGALADRIERGAELEVHSAADVVLAMGSEADLPWVDGATWLGRDGAMLLPTTLRPSLDPGLVRRAVERRVGAGAGWIVLIPDALFIGSHSTGVVDVERLRRTADPSQPA
jgi:hypothetical protein